MKRKYEVRMSVRDIRYYNRAFVTMEQALEYIYEILYSSNLQNFIERGVFDKTYLKPKDSWHCKRYKIEIDCPPICLTLVKKASGDINQDKLRETIKRIRRKNEKYYT